MNPNPPEVVTQGEGLLPVIQTDRDLAAEIFIAPANAAAARRGERDDHPIVQKLARHRQTHSTRLAAGGELRALSEKAAYEAGERTSLNFEYIEKRTGRSCSRDYVAMAIVQDALRAYHESLARDGEAGS